MTRALRQPLSFLVHLPHHQEVLTPGWRGASPSERCRGMKMKFWHSSFALFVRVRARVCVVCHMKVDIYVCLILTGKAIGP
jgi:hypothetical protein